MLSDPLLGLTDAFLPVNLVVRHALLQLPSLPLGGALAEHRLVLGRFVIRATHERGVGVPSSRSLATASREAPSGYIGCLTFPARQPPMRSGQGRARRRDDSVREVADVSAKVQDPGDAGCPQVSCFIEDVLYRRRS